jgi:hypothetical protein
MNKQLSYLKNHPPMTDENPIQTFEKLLMLFNYLVELAERIENDLHRRRP